MGGWTSKVFCCPRQFGGWRSLFCFSLKHLGLPSCKIWRLCLSFWHEVVRHYPVHISWTTEGCPCGDLCCPSQFTLEPQGLWSYISLGHKTLGITFVLRGILFYLEKPLLVPASFSATNLITIWTRNSLFIWDLMTFLLLGPFFPYDVISIFMYHLGPSVLSPTAKCNELRSWVSLPNILSLCPYVPGPFCPCPLPLGSDEKKKLTILLEI